MCSLKFCTLGKNSFVPNTAPGFCFLSLGFSNICNNRRSSQRQQLFSLLILKALHTYSCKVIFTALLDEKSRKQTLFLKVFCMKEDSKSMPMTGLTQSSTPMLKIIFESMRPIQLLEEVWDSDTAWITSQATNNQWKSTGQNTTPMRCQKTISSPKLPWELAQDTA